jgi:hypothetical protein
MSRTQDKKQQSLVKFEEPLHFRLCHICNHLNESSIHVFKCKHCSSALSSSIEESYDGDFDDIENDTQSSDAGDENNMSNGPQLFGLTALF